MKSILIINFLMISIIVNSQGKFDSKIQITDGIYLASQNDKFGIVDSKDKVILPIDFEAIEFDGSLGMTKKNGLLGLIDINGKVIIPNEYEAIEIDGNNARVVKNGKQKTIKI